jgi:hypothetical protein
MEMSVLTRATRRNIPEDTILHSHRRENLKSCSVFFSLHSLYRRHLTNVLFEFSSERGRTKYKNFFGSAFRSANMPIDTENSLVQGSVWEPSHLRIVPFHSWFLYAFAWFPFRWEIFLSPARTRFPALPFWKLFCECLLVSAFWCKVRSSEPKEKCVYMLWRFRASKQLTRSISLCIRLPMLLYAHI